MTGPWRRRVADGRAAFTAFAQAGQIAAESPPGERAGTDGPQRRAASITARSERRQPGACDHDLAALEAQVAERAVRGDDPGPEVVRICTDYRPSSSSSANRVLGGICASSKYRVTTASASSGVVISR